jgi:uncharacterized membrane protein
MGGFLEQVFALLCSQAADHTWAPGGVLLPFCQRCTGVYFGAATALLLQLTFKTRPRPWLFWLYGIFLLQMVPLGFHWVEQGPLVRTFSGQLFGFGLVGYLGLLPGARLVIPERKGSRDGWILLAFLGVTVPMLPALAMWGGQASWIFLTTLGALGLLSLALLVSIDVGLILAPFVARLGALATWIAR